MAAPEPTLTAIVNDIVTTLSNIVEGDDYHSTPGVVKRVEQWADPRLFADYGDNDWLRYYVRDTDDPVKEDANSTFRKDSRLVAIYVLTCRRWGKEPWNPLGKDVGPSPSDLRNQDIQDVTKALLVDHKRDGNACDTWVMEPERDMIGPSNWVIAEIPVLVRYYALRSAGAA